MSAVLVWLLFAAAVMTVTNVIERYAFAVFDLIDAIVDAVDRDPAVIAHRKRKRDARELRAFLDSLKEADA